MDDCTQRVAYNEQDSPVVCGAGLVSLDVLLALDRGDSVPFYAGGTCGNVLAILSYLGWRAFPIARVGTGAVAAALRDDLRQCGVREDFLFTDERAETPIIVQENRRRGNGQVSHRFVWQCPTCGNYLPMFQPPVRVAARELLTQLPRQDVFFFDRVAPSTVALAEASAERGALVVFEPTKNGNDRAFERAVRASSVIKYSRDRIPELKRPYRTKPWVEIQTSGREGLRFRLSEHRSWVRLASVNTPDAILDTSGAGDWTTAGLLDSLMRSEISVGSAEVDQIGKSVRFGQALAAINCSFEGARGAMYSLSAAKILDRAESLINGLGGGPRAEEDQITSTLMPRYFKAAYCDSCWPAL